MGRSMQLVYAFLATNAQANNGKITVFDGDWDALQVSSLPGMAPPFAVVVKLRIDAAEIDTPHQFRIEVDSPSGHRSPAQESHPIAVAPNPRNAAAPSNALILAMLAIGFDVEGEYGICVIVDDREIVRLPLLVSVPARIG
jgi:hypothetical protein